MIAIEFHPVKHLIQLLLFSMREEALRCGTQTWHQPADDYLTDQNARGSSKARAKYRGGGANRV